MWLDQVSVTGTNGALTERYDQGTAVDSIGATVWYLGDQQNSVRTVITSADRTLKTIEHDGFGTVVSNIAIAAAVRFFTPAACGTPTRICKTIATAGSATGSATIPWASPLKK